MASDYRAAVKAWMNAHREEYLADLDALVKIPSVSESGESDAPYGKNCLFALNAVLALGKKYGFETENLGNRLAKLTLRGKGNKRVGVFGHVDVVPAGAGWTKDPFRVTVSGDVIWGRGVADDKGPWLAALYGARYLKENGIALPYTLELFAGCDEEKGMSDVKWLLKNYDPPMLSLTPDAAFPVCYAEKGILTGEFVSNEPISDQILDFSGGIVSNIVPDHAAITLKKGVLTHKAKKVITAPFSLIESEDTDTILAQGVTRHAAEPEGGVNAITLLMRFLDENAIVPEKDRALFHFLSRTDEGFDGSFLGLACRDEIVGKLTFVSSLSFLRDRHLVLGFNCRYPVKASGSDLSIILRAVTARKPCSFRLLGDNPPAHLGKDDPLVPYLTSVYNGYMGCDQKPYTMAGGTYARLLPRGAAFGFEEMPLPQGLPFFGSAHRDDEGAYLPHLLDAAAIYALALQNLNSVL